MTTEPPLPPAARDALHFLRGNGPTGVESLAEALDITENAALSWLMWLCDHGLVCVQSSGHWMAQRPAVRGPHSRWAA